MTTPEGVILWRMQRPEDGKELVCALRSDDSGLLHVSLVFDGKHLTGLAGSTRKLARAVRFADGSRANLRAGGWHECDLD
jgi:hypothetical protein